jgi:hypothetical protein
MNHHRALALCLSMIFSENRFTLFRIMLYVADQVDDMNHARMMVAVLVLSAGTASARADIRIISSPGGQVGPFIELFDKVRESGERVVIDGPCLSACTLVLMTVPTERICVTRRAVLGFHAARSVDRRGRMYAEPEASKAVQEAYPEPVRNWISRHGGLTSRMIMLRGRELAAMYPRCR